MRPADLHATSLSLPEARALVTRAARGAGHTWGVAEEAGWAAAWLAAHGHDWAAILLDVLTAPGARDLALAPGAWQATSDLCPLITGIALADFATLPEGPALGLRLGPLHRPAMLLPFLDRAARTLGHGLDPLCPDGEITTLPRAEVVTLTPTGTPPAALATQSVASVTPDQIARLDDLASRTFVPSSARSRAGAGSQRSDND